ncbi:hypothetical protein CRUP_029935, partial [Coryphaenoides rupestris]
MAMQQQLTFDMSLMRSWYLLAAAMRPACSRVRRFLRILRFFCSRGSWPSSRTIWLVFRPSGVWASCTARRSTIWATFRYQRRYRQRRKAELVKLQQTLAALNSKADFYQDQTNYYDTYIKTCLDNLNTKNSRRSIKGAPDKGQARRGSSSPSSTRAPGSTRRAWWLEIEGLQTNQNVMFEIAPCEEVGDFEVKAKFMGVEMEKVQLHFQDLLQLQYDGVAVMKMFDKAKVNVNLLVFLLNKKFYG